MMTEAVLLRVLGSTGSPSAPYPTTKIPYCQSSQCQLSVAGVPSTECAATSYLVEHLITSWC